MTNPYRPRPYNNYGNSTPGFPRYDPIQQSPNNLGYGYQPEKQKTNSFAIASFVFSLLGVGCFGVNGIVAIVFGIKARKEIAEDPSQGGAGYALAGIILGSIFLGISFIGMFIWFIILLSRGY